MGTDAASRYIDLMKQALTFSLWPEPPIALTHPIYAGTKYDNFIIAFISRILNRGGLQLVKDRGVTAEERTNGQFWPAYADTMVGLKRLDNIQHCIETVLKDRIRGDFIELGVWREARAYLCARS